ncbi:hypothetical protein GCM10023212_05960 [Luteolibacter yonseiensis]
MKSKWPVICVFAAAGSFFAGRLTTGPTVKASPLPTQVKLHREGFNSVISTQEDNPNSDSRRRVSRSDRTAGEKEPRVSIPLKAVTEILKESQFSYSDFEVIIRKMPDALTMLGVGDSDKKAALEVMEASYRQILDEEKKHVRVTMADETGISLDRTGMDEPSKQVIATTQEGLRGSLPSDVAEALIGSIDWDRYYFNTTKTTSFRITRNPSGSLAATTTTGTGAMSSGLLPTEYPDDGTPISAEAVFDKRWSHHLKGKTLLPVDK